MHILIIEDEIPAFEKLRTQLSAYLRDELTYDWARSVNETLHFLDTNTGYDCIFSDIQLLDGSSFEAFEKRTISIPIIFCSAYDEYLLHAFQSNGIAYILKPYGIKEIEGAIGKYKKLFQQQENQSTNAKVFNDLKNLLQQRKKNYKERFVIKSRKGIHLLETKDIALVDAEGDFCKLIDRHGKTHLYSDSIGSIYDKLDPSLFFRINRSQLVHMPYIEHIEPHFKNRLLLNITGRKDQVMTSSSTTANFRIWLET